VAGIFIWFWRDIKRRERDALRLKQQHEEQERLLAMHRLKSKAAPRKQSVRPALVPIKGGRSGGKPVARTPTRTGVVQAESPKPVNPGASAPASTSSDLATAIGLLELGIAAAEILDSSSTTSSSNNDADNTSYSSGGGGDFGGGGASSSWDSSSSSSDSSSSSSSGD
jgi:uncharacterized membrane protein YgcG